MMAQAGATFRHLADQPLNKPGIPCSLKMYHRNRGMDNSSGRNAACPTDEVIAESAPCFTTCCLVLPTSKGVVTNAATAPDDAPAMKLSTNVVVVFSLLLLLLFTLYASAARPSIRSLPLPLAF